MPTSLGARSFSSCSMDSWWTDLRSGFRVDSVVNGFGVSPSLSGKGRVR
jgi:hypothetical protein